MKQCLRYLEIRAPMAPWLISDHEVTKDGVTVAKSIDLKSMPEMERAYHMFNIYIYIHI